MENLNIVVSESARLKLTDDTFNTIVTKIKAGSKSKSISGIKILRKLSAIILL